MTDLHTAFVIKRTADGKYLADRFYQMSWGSLPLARTFLSEDMAARAASDLKGVEVKTIILAEYEPE